MAEWQILEDAVGIGGPEDPGLSQGSAAAGTLGLKQVAAACASEKDFSPARYLETFGHGFSGLNAFGASHSFCFGVLYLPVTMDLPASLLPVSLRPGG